MRWTLRCLCNNTTGTGESTASRTAGESCKDIISEQIDSDGIGDSSIPCTVPSSPVLSSPCSGTPVAGEGDDEASEASKWEERERAERLVKLRTEEERLGEEWWLGEGSFFFFSLSLNFLCYFPLFSQGAEKPQLDGDLRRIRSGGETDYLCILP